MAYDEQSVTKKPLSVVKQNDFTIVIGEGEVNTSKSSVNEAKYEFHTEFQGINTPVKTERLASYFEKALQDPNSGDRSTLRIDGNSSQEETARDRALSDGKYVLQFEKGTEKLTLHLPKAFSGELAAHIENVENALENIKVQDLGFNPKSRPTGRQQIETQTEPVVSVATVNNVLKEIPELTPERREQIVNVLFQKTAGNLVKPGVAR